jgi:hypothetical protein
LTASETGHLVFGTLHTSSAPKTIDRIIDVFPAGEKPMVRSMLSESLRAVISQALLKKKGGGRMAAHEIMVGVPAIRNLIREDKVAQMYSSIQTGAPSACRRSTNACWIWSRKGGRCGPVVSSGATVTRRPASRNDPYNHSSHTGENIPPQQIILRQHLVNRAVHQGI